MSRGLRLAVQRVHSDKLTDLDAGMNETSSHRQDVVTLLVTIQEMTSDSLDVPMSRNLPTHSTPESFIGTRRDQAPW